MANSYGNPFCKLKKAAAPIIAPLSVHNPGRGVKTGTSIISFILFLKRLFAATPPPKMTPLALLSKTAFLVFRIRQSTIASWKAKEYSVVW